MPACEHGVKDATAIADRIRALWAKCPDASVAIAGGGPARLVVIDVDGDRGRQSIAALETEIGTLPLTAMVRTPRGGWHLYFIFPSSLDISRVKNSVGKIAPKVDVRAVGGYVVAPPTPGYEWISTDPVAELPVAWAERLLPRGGYADAALKDAETKVRQAAEGERNDTLNREAFSLGGLVAAGTLSEYVVREVLISAAVAAGLPEAEARRTVDSGLRAGMQHPREAAGGAAQPADNDPDWKASLRFDKRGALSKDASNALILLVNHEAWKGCLGYSAFSDRIHWVKDPPLVNGVTGPVAGDELSEHHAGYVQLALAAMHGVSFARGTVFDAMADAARENTRNELREYLDGLRWDGTPRADVFLSAYLGADDTEYTRKVSVWWLVGAVARAYRPGCQCDHVLVLSGTQGAGKSSAVRILAGEWYLGSLPDLREKDAVQVLQGRWLVELGELDALRGAAGTRVKDFLTQSVDVYRPSYGRLAVRRPRQCSFIGTTNEEHYLQDGTGARRFWPVPVRGLNRAALIRDRDQIWAEAVMLFQDGQRWWPDHDDAEMLEEQQEAHYVGDAWEPVIARWAVGRAPFTIGEVLEGALKLDPERWDRSSQTRVGVILRRLGFAYHRGSNSGARVRLYERA
jgi:predicted P-loop ATPase